MRPALPAAAPPAAALLAAALLAAAALALAAPAAAAPRPVIALEGGWLRATAPGQTSAAAYFTILNRGTAPDRLLSARSPVAHGAGLHLSRTSGGVVRMRPLAHGAAIGGGRRLELRPGGLHLMLTGLAAPLRPGGRVPLLLRFERAGEVRASLRVVDAAAGHAGH